MPRKSRNVSGLASAPVVADSIGSATAPLTGQTGSATTIGSTGSDRTLADIIGSEAQTNNVGQTGLSRRSTRTTTVASAASSALDTAGAVRTRNRPGTTKSRGRRTAQPPRNESSPARSPSCSRPVEVTSNLPKKLSSRRARVHDEDRESSESELPAKSLETATRPSRDSNTSISEDISQAVILNSILDECRALGFSTAEARMFIASKLHTPVAASQPDLHSLMEGIELVDSGDTRSNAGKHRLISEEPVRTTKATRSTHRSGSEFKNGYSKGGKSVKSYQVGEMCIIVGASVGDDVDELTAESTRRMRGQSLQRWSVGRQRRHSVTSTPNTSNDRSRDRSQPKDLNRKGQTDRVMIRGQLVPIPQYRGVTSAVLYLQKFTKQFQCPSDAG